MPRATAWLALFGLAAACAALAQGNAAMQGPAQAASEEAAAGLADRILFSHALHAESGVSCETCHAAAESQTGGDNLLPAMETCGACHDIASSEHCGMCHANPEAPGIAPRVTAVAQRFPHARHVSGEGSCERCHGPVQAGPHLPDKSLCRNCHETASGLSDCRLCHADTEPLRPSSHGPEWELVHASAARVDASRCSVCHSQTDCQQCHSGDNVRPRVHPLNFSFRHALEARGQEQSCAACHEDPQFCQACHAARQVLPSDHSRADWVTRQGGRHAEEAEFDLESCTACHEGGSPVCARCHGR
ncbi:MAG: cytochrome c3 family protein [Candidatus Eisenbacteria bacterium]|nr:cytochrome c3 family protein [Candidatus Eisenbacteria bacterium]